MDAGSWLFIVGFVLCVAGATFYFVGQSKIESPLLPLIRDLQTKFTEVKNLADATNSTANSIKMSQTTLEGKCLEAVDAKTAGLLKKIDDLIKENDVLKVRLTSVDKRFRELPRTVSVKIEEPVKVDVLSIPKPAPPASPLPVGKGQGSLLERAGVKTKGKTKNEK